MMLPMLHTWNLNLGSAKRLAAVRGFLPALGDCVVFVMAAHAPKPVPEPPDFYRENGLLVSTAAFHLKRGVCCGSGCRHCPYEPRHTEGSRKVGQEPGGVAFLEGRVSG